MRRTRVVFGEKRDTFWNKGEKESRSQIFICAGRDTRDVIFACREDDRLEVLGFGLIRVSAEDEDIDMMFHAFGDSYGSERPHDGEKNFFWERQARNQHTISSFKFCKRLKVLG